MDKETLIDYTSFFPEPYPVLEGILNEAVKEEVRELFEEMVKNQKIRQ